MRIELIIGDDDAIIYPIRDKQILVGSSKESHIIIPAATGVSRKHLQVTVENDRYFITDLGSTNGTFINDERQIPGKKTEFTTFFPVRLGLNVFLSLLSGDENAQNLNADAQSNKTSTVIEEGTHVIDPRHLNKIPSKTKLSVRRTPVRAKKTETIKKSPASDSSRMKIIIITIVAIVSLLFLKNKEVDELAFKSAEISKVKKSLPLPPPPVIPPPDLVKDTEIPSMAELQTMFGEVKCATSLE